MNRTIPAQIGRVCFSRQGRDKGRYFVITGIVDDQHVLIADGVMRKLTAPKKKKLKHLSLKPAVLDSIAEKLLDGRKVFDAELKSAIINTGYIALKEE